MSYMSELGEFVRDAWDAQEGWIGREEGRSDRGMLEGRRKQAIGYRLLDCSAPPLLTDGDEGSVEDLMSQ